MKKKKRLELKKKNAKRRIDDCSKCQHSRQKLAFYCEFGKTSVNQFTRSNRELKCNGFLAFNQSTLDAFE